jgi:ribosomal protein S12 methylthiotransferase accessory factor
MATEMRIHFPGGAQAHADYKGFTVRTDQPPPTGEGKDPSPFDLFLASMGTCAGIYVLRFCQERGISTDGMEIIQTLDYDAATRLIKTVNLEIKAPAGFPERYHAALVQSAKLCAVKKHLEHPPEFNVFVTSG